MQKLYTTIPIAISEDMNTKKKSPVATITTLNPITFPNADLICSNEFCH